MADVFKVPAQRRMAFVRAQSDHIFIESEDADTWEQPIPEELKLLLDFINNAFKGAPMRYWSVSVGRRMGYNNEGVFLHENHHKRFYGLSRKGAGVSLQAHSSDAVPLVNAKGEKVLAGDKTEQMLGKMMQELPSLSDDMRFKILHAAFQRADRNSNGKISRPELSTLLRRVVHTLTSKDVQAIMLDADKDDDHEIDYKEFVGWLQSAANSRVTNALCKSLRNDSDIIRAIFRQWDANGDGMIPDPHLFKVLRQCHPNYTPQQAKALVKCMDSDKDGNCDYDEFIDFLFHRK